MKCPLSLMYDNLCCGSPVAECNMWYPSCRPNGWLCCSYFLHPEPTLFRSCLRVALGCLVFGCRKVFERIERPEFEGPRPVEGYALLHRVLRRRGLRGCIGIPPPLRTRSEEGGAARRGRGRGPVYYRYDARWSSSSSSDGG